MREVVQSLVYASHGGMLSTHEMRLLAEAAGARGDGRVRFTERQEVVLRGLALHQARRLLEQPDIQRLAEWDIRRRPNIVTTASALGLPGASEWLTAGLFADALATLDHSPRVGLSLCDPAQTFVPSLTSSINLLASRQRDLWHIHTQQAMLPGAVRTRDLARAAMIIAENALDLPRMTAALEPLLINLELPTLPRVDHYGDPADALIIPALDDGIAAGYLVDLCLFVAEHSNVSMSITPWRQLCVRGLDPTMRHRAQHQLMRWRVPAALPWQRVFCNSEHVATATRLRAKFASECPVDAGVSWAVVGPAAVPPEAHVAVQTMPARGLRRGRFNVLIRDGGSARFGEWRTVVTNIPEREIVRAVLRGLCDVASIAIVTAPAAVTTAAESHKVCQDCLTEYDAAYGDVTRNIVPGTGFDSLPPDWSCPVCGAEKRSYLLAARATP